MLHPRNDVLPTQHQLDLTIPPPFAVDTSIWIHMFTTPELGYKTFIGYTIIHRLVPTYQLVAHTLVIKEGDVHLLINHPLGITLSR